MPISEILQKFTMIMEIRKHKITFIPLIDPLDFRLDKCRLNIVLKLRRKCEYPTAGDRILAVTALPDL